MNRTTRFALASTALSTAMTLQAASGQVMTIGAFTGDYSDSFEGRTMAFGSCVQSGVFGGQGQLCAMNAFLATMNSWTCQTTPRSGGRFFISTMSDAEFTFATPVSRFGGYFAGGHPGEAGATVEFYDEGGRLIASTEADFPVNCGWYWQGWASTVPVSRIVVRGHVSPSIGGLIGMDDMQIGFEAPPAPCYADCNTETGAGVLDALDVLCFQQAFLAGAAGACDADTSTGAGVCDILDFMAYMDAFLAGCEPNDPPASVPLDAETTSDMLAAELLDLRDQTASLDPSRMTGPNNNASRGRRTALANRLTDARNDLLGGDLGGAAEHLRSFLARVDGDPRHKDWVEPGRERDELSRVAGAMLSVIDLLRAM